MSRTTATILATACAFGEAAQTDATMTANPVRKVVTMLQDLQSKVDQEGKKADELFEKYDCYCHKNKDVLAASIDAADEKMGKLSPSIEAKASSKQELENALKSHYGDRAGAKEAMATADAIRTDEKTKHDKERSESEINIAAIRKAVKALNKGMSGGSLLQTLHTSTLKYILEKSKAGYEADRQEVLAFLSGSSKYAPQSGEISGIIEQIGDEMDADLKNAIKEEGDKVTAHGALTESKQKEVKALSKMIENKLARVSELGIEIASMKNDLGNTGESLVDDKAFLADLDKNCDTKADTHQKEQATRAQEVQALAETIKVLNDDDALDLFKGTLGKQTSLLQVRVTNPVARDHALSVISAAQTQASSVSRPGLDFIALALRGQKVGFEKVVALIDNLVKTLKTEQQDDEAKKSYCADQIDRAEDKAHAIGNKQSDLDTSISGTKDDIAETKEEIANLQAGLKSLEKSVAEATEQRQAENSEHKDLVANNGAAKQLIQFAKNRLNKFYNPKLYIAPPAQKMSREDQIFVNNGGTPPPTEAPGGIAGTGIAVPSFVQLVSRKGVEAPPPPPATAAAYSKKSQESNGVIAMMDILASDLEKETTESTSQEKVSQEEYVKMMEDSREKKTVDSNSLTSRQGAKANFAEELEQQQEAHGSATKDLMATEKYLSNLHGECDWLLQHFEARKEARTNEVDSLNKAKAVLGGADFSLIQEASQSRARKFLRSQVN